MFGFFSKLSDLDDFPLRMYSLQVNLDGLVVGVDNIRHDVHLSPTFSKATQHILKYIIAKHSHAEQILELKKTSLATRDLDAFRRTCIDFLKGAVDKAKSGSKNQIDMLAQIALIKMLTEELREQYNGLIKKLNDSVRKLEVSKQRDLKKTIKIKEQLSHIQEQKNSILTLAGSELFQFIVEAQNEGVKEMREAVLGPKSNLPDDVFLNPILYLQNVFDDKFRIERYVLLGHRFEDPDNYQTILGLIRNLLRKLQDEGKAAAELPTQDGKDFDLDEDTDVWLKQVENIDIIFDCFRSQERYKGLKKQKGSKDRSGQFKVSAKKQKRLLDFFYKKFKRANLIERISAAYEMQSIYLAYCPPLVPHQVRQFLIHPRQRKSIINQLNRLKGFYGKPFPLTPLKRKVKQIKKVNSKQKKKYLLRFLNDFARYHRDYQNFKILETAMDQVNLVTDPKTLMLSRENYTLYEFLLPDERALEKRPIINHVVIKADVRDSTNVTSQMKARGLNPASFFSLNFFNPITEILFDYTAEKVFIEGDAVILSISEHEDTPEGWYSVSRACGLAIQMLLVVQKYNETSKKYQLPVLEIGIGICHNDKPPTFLFDETNRIMISPAINSADRLSSNTKTLAGMINKKDHPFNLYVFKSTSPDALDVKAAGNALRYNVNGIELNAAGFGKLSKEIDLKPVECRIPQLQKDAIKVHTGKFPTKSGKYRRLVIREAEVQEISLREHKVVGSTADKYYEVCTHAKVYQYVRNLQRSH